MVTSEDVEALSSSCLCLVLDEVRDRMAWNAEEAFRGGNSSFGVGGSARFIRDTARCSKGVLPEGRCGPGPREDGGNFPEEYKLRKEAGGEGLSALDGSDGYETKGIEDCLGAGLVNGGR
jgi:hypothetical protein